MANIVSSYDMQMSWMFPLRAKKEVGMLEYARMVIVIWPVAYILRSMYL